MSKEVGSGGSVGVDGESGSGGKPARSSNCGCAPAVTKVHLAVSGVDQLQQASWRFKIQNFTSLSQGVPRETGGREDETRVSPCLTLTRVWEAAIMALNLLARNLLTSLSLARPARAPSILWSTNRGFTGPRKGTLGPGPSPASICSTISSNSFALIGSPEN